MQKQIVYLMMKQVDYEAYDVIGVYWDKEYAQKLADEMNSDDWNLYSVEPWIVS